MSVPFGMSVFTDITGASLTYEVLTLADLARQIEDGIVATKADQPLAKLAKFGTQRTEKGSLRHDLNAVHCTGIEVEHDAGVMPFAEVKGRLAAAGVAFLLYTTASHTGAHPRWRVLCPFSKTISPGERAQYVDRLNGLLGGVLTRESWGISQSFYIGRVAGAPFEITYADTEECVDDIDELAAGAMSFQPPKKKKTGGEFSFKDAEDEELVEAIETSKHFFRAISELAYRRAQDGMLADDIEATVTGYLDTVPAAQRDDKWSKAKARLRVWIDRVWIDKAYTRAAAVAAARRPKLGGRPLVFVPPTPWHEEIDGSALLDEIAATIRSYVVMPDAAKYTSALWIAHTYVFTAMMITPRLVIKSAQKRCGKTTLLIVVGELASRALNAVNMSAAAVYRTVEQAQPTLMIDEAETLLRDNDELRRVINTGYIRGAQAIRITGDEHESRLFACWSPVLLATIKPLPDTTEDRTIEIVLERRLKGEPVIRVRLDRLTQLAPLRSKLQRWANDNLTALETAGPEVPETLNDRAGDCWRIMFAIDERAAVGNGRHARIGRP